MYIFLFYFLFSFVIFILLLHKTIKQKKSIQINQITAFWLQGPYPSDTSATATTAQVYQFKDNNMENGGQIILNNPRSIDHSNGNIKVVHRNQTIVELNNNNNSSNDNNISNIFNNSNNNISNISNDDVIMVTNYNYDHYNNPSPVVRPTTLNFLQSGSLNIFFYIFNIRFFLSHD